MFMKIVVELWSIILFAFPEGENGEMVEEEVIGPMPKQQVTLSRKDYGKVSNRNDCDKGNVLVLHCSALYWVTRIV